MKSAIAPAFLAIVASLSTAQPEPALAQGSAVLLASHRAVYDLKLAQSRGKRPMSAVSGRILYDFSGSPCEGYALQFRQVSQLDSGEGKVSLSDLRATTWEEGSAKRLRFHSQNFLDDRLRDAVDGQAERLNNGIGVKLTQPSDKSMDYSVEVVFPTEHVRRVIAAAREGKTVYEAVVYDGSESGEKLYDTTAIIGNAIAPQERVPSDAAAKSSALDSLTRWPVTISYFDKGKQGGEQLPIYSITFELYENGVSRALLLDYGDFVVSGEMTQLEIKDSKPCP
jgi:EipB-like